MRDLRAHAADGRTGDPLLAERRRRLRRRLPALRRDGGRVRLDPRGRADLADRSRRAPARRGGFLCDDPRHPAARPSRRRSPPSRSCAGSPSRSSRWSRRPISSTRRSTAARSAGSQVARRAAVSVVVALGRQRRGRRDGRVGHLLVPVPRRSRTRTTRCGSRGAATIPSELEGPFTDWNAHMEDDGRIVPDIARALDRGSRPPPALVH